MCRVQPRLSEGDGVLRQTAQSSARRWEVLIFWPPVRVCSDGGSMLFTFSSFYLNFLVPKTPFTSLYIQYKCRTSGVKSLDCNYQLLSLLRNLLIIFSMKWLVCQKNIIKTSENCEKCHRGLKNIIIKKLESENVFIFLKNNWKWFIDYGNRCRFIQ